MRIAATLIFLGSAAAFWAPSAHALSGTLELGAAGNVERFDSGTLDYGLSFRARYTRYELKGFDHGLFFQIAYPMGFPSLLDLMAGYGVRFGSNVFLELAAGGKYSALFGTGAVLIAGTGFRLGGSWYVSIPVVYKLGFSIEYMPHLGYEF